MLNSSAQSAEAERLRVDVHYRPSEGDDFARDVRRGLGTRPKTLHPKYFYDERGSRLFDQICDTREYYPTRTEHALLDGLADSLIEDLKPEAIVELGSGTARKTRRLLAAAGRVVPNCRYVPIDVSEEVLRDTARELSSEFPWLEIHGLVADYTQRAELMPPYRRRLIVFIGSTIGNFDHEDAVGFLASIAAEMGEDDRLVLGTDLVKDHGVLEAAYNDAQGLTADFNKNMLSVLNRELGADFDLNRFEHDARFVPAASQVELRLRSTQEQRVNFRDLDWGVDFHEGETILTEVSRKFTQQSVTRTLRQAGLQLVDWHTPDNEYFALSVSRRIGPPTAPAGGV